MANEPEERAPELRALFDSYPQPTADAAFDARFWRELDARRNRYRGIAGLLRRLVEVEIEGVALWRLGFSLFGGAAACALGVALLSLGGAAPTTAPPQIAAVAEEPSMFSRYARQPWDDAFVERSAPQRSAPQPRPPAKKEVSPWNLFATSLV